VAPAGASTGDNKQINWASLAVNEPLISPLAAAIHARNPLAPVNDFLIQNDGQGSSDIGCASFAKQAGAFADPSLKLTTGWPGIRG